MGDHLELTLIRSQKAWRSKCERECTHATHGILVPFTFDALLLALSRDVHIHGTKVISNCLNSATQGSVILQFCCGRASEASCYCYICVWSPWCVCVLVLSLALSSIIQITYSFQCLFVKPDNMKQLLVSLWICLSTSHSIVRNKL